MNSIQNDLSSSTEDDFIGLARHWTFPSIFTNQPSTPCCRSPGQRYAPLDGRDMTAPEWARGDLGPGTPGAAGGGPTEPDIVKLRFNCIMRLAPETFSGSDCISTDPLFDT
jgi:hypothetical protein